MSVVVPVRNAEDTIAACLTSLLAGDYPVERRELIVVDNGSTDRTAEIVRSFGVRCLHEPRRGVSHARNRGIDAARGAVIAFIDGDCLAGPTWISEIARPFEDPTVGCVAGELQHGDPGTPAQRQATRMLGHWQRFATGSEPPYAITANAAFRREVFDQIGPFDPRMPRAQDVEIGLRFNRRSPLRLVYSAEAVVHHRHRPTQLGFLRQQIGWAYGAGLVGAKHRTALADRDPPRLREVGRAAGGLWLVVAARARRRARPEHLEDAWFELLRGLAWWLGGWAGIVRGSRIFDQPEGRRDSA